VHRSMSLSARQSRPKSCKDETSDIGVTLKRSSSMEGRNKKNKANNKDEISEKKREKNKGR